jgi:hypothetical protein
VIPFDSNSKKNRAEFENPFNTTGFIDEKLKLKIFRATLMLKYFWLKSVPRSRQTVSGRHKQMVLTSPGRSDVGGGGGGLLLETGFGSVPTLEVIRHFRK